MAVSALARPRRRRPDPFGYDPAFHRRVRPYAEFLYRRYWRVQVDGLNHVPGSGPALIVGNHSGGIPFDASMIATAVDLDHPQHRLVRFLYDRFVADMPYVGPAYNRLGAVPASYLTAYRVLQTGALVGIFPEGVAGVAKGVGQRYRLQRFHTGFIRLSLTLQVPIVPVAVVGAEEIYPVIGKWTQLGPLKEMLNVPYIPITPLFPLFGLLGVVPLPTKWHIRFGEPIRLYLDPKLRAARRQTATRLAEQVRRRIQAMVHEMLAARESLF
ncbi:MAG TPA: lysophospholipid acyltransferase family protein [Candidatus Binatia bacterium]|nr:lysophospholipid acyltransferase family protein [Candidatus Binatia bacterium]